MYRKRYWGLMNCCACGRRSWMRPACFVSWAISIRIPLLRFTKSFRQSRPKPSSTPWKSTTPQHASWLDVAEIELSVLAKQGLTHNIATIEELCEQIQSWQTYRSQQVDTANWQFRTADSRIKLKHLFPVTS